MQLPPKSHKTTIGRFNVMTAGLVLGFALGIFLIRDYQLVKYEPPNPDNFDENGNWKEKSFIKVRLRDVQPLSKKSDEQAARSSSGSDAGSEPVQR